MAIKVKKKYLRSHSSLMDEMIENCKIKCGEKQWSQIQRYMLILFETTTLQQRKLFFDKQFLMTKPHYVVRTIETVITAIAKKREEDGLIQDMD